MKETTKRQILEPAICAYAIAAIPDDLDLWSEAEARYKKEARRRKAERAAKKLTSRVYALMLVLGLLTIIYPLIVDGSMAGSVEGRGHDVRFKVENTEWIYANVGADIIRGNQGNDTIEITQTWNDWQEVSVSTPRLDLASLYLNSLSEELGGNPPQAISLMLVASDGPTTLTTPQWFDMHFARRAPLKSLWYTQLELFPWLKRMK